MIYDEKSLTIIIVVFIISKIYINNANGMTRKQHFKDKYYMLSAFNFYEQNSKYQLQIEL